LYCLSLIVDILIIGIGTTLNWLTCGKRLDGLPVHIFLRALLDCYSMTDVRTLAHSKWALGKSSAITIAQGSHSLSLELFDDHVAILPTPHRHHHHHHHHHENKNNNSDCSSNAASPSLPLPLPHLWFVRSNHYLSKLVNSPTSPTWASTHYRYDSARLYCQQMATTQPLLLQQMKQLLLDCHPQEGTGLCVFAPFRPSPTVIPLPLLSLLYLPSNQFIWYLLPCHVHVNIC
jgi:hypothetical protein